MNFDKQTIDLVREIRRRAPGDSKSGIKLTNPELLDELLALHRASSDATVNSLIKKLFDGIGDGWPERLLTGVEATESPARHDAKVYRGQTRATEIHGEKGDEIPTGREEKKNERSVRIYRGRVVTD